MDLLRDEFSDPQAIYRSAPFWSWNDKLEVSELERQVGEMAEQGLGGFFMHSRVGLLTPYMGSEWMACVAACVDKARQLGTKAWLYDEDRWPSGFAGGMVPGDVKEHAALDIGCRGVSSPDELPGPDSTAAVFSWDGKAPESIGEMLDYAKAKKGKGPFVVFETKRCEKKEWLNDGPYPSLIQPGAVDAFIKSTYEPYYERFGKEFGKTIPGIFTDEPAYTSLAWGSEVSIPWTAAFDDIFQRENGYSLLPHLPGIFFDLPGHEKPRYDYWRTLTGLFVTNFSRKMGEWCEKHGLWLTGHYLCEDDLYSQVCFIGNAMAHYEYMQAPGVDHLGENIKFLMTMKQVSSVANQLGKPRVLSELYGGSGWDFSFEGQKWIGDWEYSLGVNLRCQHLSLYTLRGCRKRDYPPSILYQQPWWKHYRIVEDYFGRLGLVLSSGEYQPEVLVIHPINSAYIGYIPGKSEHLADLDTSFKDLSTWLCELHCMYDYGDEGIMERYGSARDGALVVGRMSYRAVIIPPSRTLQTSTLELLKRFAAQGGTVVAIAPYPTMLDAEPSDDLKSFLARQCRMINLDKDTLNKAIEETVGRGVAVKDFDGNEIADIYVHRRRTGDSDVLFLNNISRERAYDVVVTVKAVGLVENWDLVNGAVEDVPAETDGNTTRLKLHFEPVGSYLISVDTSKTPSAAPPQQVPAKEEEVITFDSKWKFERTSPNLLTLDYCRYRIGRGEWSGLTPVWKAQKEIRAYFGLKPLWHNGGVSFWKAEELGLNDIEKPEEVSLKFTYRTEVPETKMSFILESPEIFEISLNNQSVDFESNYIGEFIEPCFRMTDVTGLSHTGENEIVLTCEYRGQYEFENIYLAGDFGVYQRDGSFVLDKEPAFLTVGDWVPQGYPFYQGTMRYRAEFNLEKRGDERYFLKFERLGSIVINLLINGRNAGIIAWKPYQCDVTRLIEEKNSIYVDVVTSLRNMLGPHHNTDGETANFVSPRSFSDEKRWSDSYLFVPYGILGETRLVRVTE